MKPYHLWISLLLAGGLAAAPVCGAVQLLTVENPSPITLVDRGMISALTAAREVHSVVALKAGPDLSSRPVGLGRNLQIASSWYVPIDNALRTAQPIRLLANDTSVSADNTNSEEFWTDFLTVQSDAVSVTARAASANPSPAPVETDAFAAVPDAFAAVPEANQLGWVGVPIAGLISSLGRRRRTRI